MTRTGREPVKLSPFHHTVNVVGCGFVLYGIVNAILGYAPPETKSAEQIIFERYDVDRDNSLSPEEFRRYLDLNK